MIGINMEDNNQSTSNSYLYCLFKWRRNRKHFRHYNLVKYYFFSNVLDILVKYRYEKHMDAVPYSFISNIIYNQYAIPEFMHKVNYDESIGFIKEMEWMRLIDIDFDNNESLVITDEGLRMYETQKFHSIYSSLLEAHSSRILSRNAVIFACISSFIALLSLVL